MPGKTRDVHHRGVVGLGEAHRLAGRNVELEQMAGRSLDQSVSGEIGVTDREHPRAEYPALRVEVPLQVAELLQCAREALRGALGDPGRRGNLPQVQGSPLAAEGME